MNESPAISICIPAYKNADFVYRLLQSIVNQSFSDYEVIVSDDSPDDSVEKLIHEFQGLPNLKYFRNHPPAGTPSNWNFAIRQATGKWIKLMHDDDWFNSSDALLVFIKNTEKYTDCNFFYCAYNNVKEGEEKHAIKNTWLDLLLLKLDIFNIFRKNTIGNPSCILLKNNGLFHYDEKLKWLVDIDYYITYLSANNKIKYIPCPLVNVGINVQQVTHVTFRNPAVELPENFRILEKHGIKILKNIIVYDHYWRLIRNLDIRNMSQITAYYKNNVVSQIVKMIATQSHYGNRLLRIGIFSKLLMVVQYIKFRLQY